MSATEEFTAPAGHVIRFVLASGRLAVTIKYPGDQGVVGFSLAAAEMERVRQMLTSDREEAR